MSFAEPDAIFLHCLPAHRGEEVSESVLEGPQSRVWAEAENRLHIQKAIMAVLMGDEVLRAPKKAPVRTPTRKSVAAKQAGATKAVPKKAAGKPAVAKKNRSR
jgi:hypothetical protein